MNAQALFQAVIEDCQPASLLVAGDHARAAARHWQQNHPQCPVTELNHHDGELTGDGTRPHDLALISDTLEPLPPEQGNVLLGQVRNLGNLRIAVLVSNTSHWSLTDFLALGFVRQAGSEDEQGSTLYTYNLDSYNHKRTWNNPKNWANPEMWGKAWW